MSLSDPFLRALANGSPHTELVKYISPRSRRGQSCRELADNRHVKRKHKKHKKPRPAADPHVATVARRVAAVEAQALEQHEQQRQVNAALSRRVRGLREIVVAQEAKIEGLSKQQAEADAASERAARNAAARLARLDAQTTASVHEADERHERLQLQLRELRREHHRLGHEQVRLASSAAGLKPAATEDAGDAEAEPPLRPVSVELEDEGPLPRLLSSPESPPPPARPMLSPPPPPPPPPPPSLLRPPAAARSVGASTEPSLQPKPAPAATPTQARPALPPPSLRTSLAAPAQRPVSASPAPAAAPRQVAALRPSRSDIIPSATTSAHDRDRRPLSAPKVRPLVKTLRELAEGFNATLRGGGSSPERRSVSPPAAPCEIWYRERAPVAAAAAAAAPPRGGGGGRGSGSGGRGGGGGRDSRADRRAEAERRASMAIAVEYEQNHPELPRAGDRLRARVQLLDSDSEDEEFRLSTPGVDYVKVAERYERAFGGRRL